MAIWADRGVPGVRPPLSHPAKAVGTRLARYFPRIYPSMKVLCAELTMSERCVRDAIRELERAGIIKTYRRYNRSSRYVFLDCEGNEVRVLRLGHIRLGSTPPPAPDSSSPGSDPPPAGAVPASGAGLVVPASGAPVPASGAALRRRLTPDKVFTNDVTEGGERARARVARRKRRGSPPRGFDSLDGWLLPDAWRIEWQHVGLPLAALERRWSLERLRVISPPVTDRTAYVRHWFEQWLEWEAEKRSRNADCGAGKGAPSSPNGSGVPWAPTARERARAAKFGLTLGSPADLVVLQLAERREQEQLEQRLASERAELQQAIAAQLGRRAVA